MLGKWTKPSSSYLTYYFLMIHHQRQMIALIPDQVPRHQTGTANGVLALLLVTGSLFGFVLFHSFLSENIQDMYGLYTCVVIATSVLTGTHAHDTDAALTAARLERRERRRSMQASSPIRRSTSDDLAVLSSPGPSWRKKAKKVAKRVARRAKAIVLTPGRILQSMVDPLRTMDWKSLSASYTIDIKEHPEYFNFFIVTVSRLFYYCGMSVQTFFLYYVHDIVELSGDPESAVAALAVLSQCSGALTCYPVGWISDRFLSGSRRPFVYFSCVMLALLVVGLIFATTLHQMAILVIFLGAANGIYLTMDTSLAVDTLPEEDSSKDEGDQVGGSAQLLGGELSKSLEPELIYVHRNAGMAASKSTFCLESRFAHTSCLCSLGCCCIPGLDARPFDRWTSSLPIRQKR